MSGFEDRISEKRFPEKMAGIDHVPQFEERKEFAAVRDGQAIYRTVKI